MTDCEHCGETFDDEAGYLRHLDAEHPDEMGRIEERKLEEIGGSRGDGASMPLVLAGIAVGALVLAVVVYTITVGSGGSNTGLGELGPAPDPPGHELGPPGDDEVYRPYQIGDAHEHGQIDVTVEGESLDFRQPEFQHPQTISAFHFESGEPRWHAHAEGVTLEFALEATAFGVTNTSFAYDGVIYRTGSNADAPDGWRVVTDATIVYRVNGNTVQPETYVLQEGDQIEVVVQPPRGTDESGSTNTTTSNQTVSSSGR